MRAGWEIGFGGDRGGSEGFLCDGLDTCAVLYIHVQRLLSSGLMENPTLSRASRLDLFMRACEGTVLDVTWKKARSTLGRMIRPAF